MAGSVKSERNANHVEWAQHTGASKADSPLPIIARRTRTTVRNGVMAGKTARNARKWHMIAAVKTNVNCALKRSLRGEHAVALGPSHTVARGENVYSAEAQDDPGNWPRLCVQISTRYYALSSSYQSSNNENALCCTLLQLSRERSQRPPMGQEFEVIRSPIKSVNNIYATIWLVSV